MSAFINDIFSDYGNPRNTKKIEKLFAKLTTSTLLP